MLKWYYFAKRNLDIVFLNRVILAGNVDAYLSLVEPMERVALVSLFGDFKTGIFDLSAAIAPTDERGGENLMDIVKSAAHTVMLVPSLDIDTARRHAAMRLNDREKSNATARFKTLLNETYLVRHLESVAGRHVVETNGKSPAAVASEILRVCSP